MATLSSGYKYVWWIDVQVLIACVVAFLRPGTFIHQQFADPFVHISSARDCVKGQRVLLRTIICRNVCAFPATKMPVVNHVNVI